jgi:hypothetical protein
MPRMQQVEAAVCKNNSTRAAVGTAEKRDQFFLRDDTAHGVLKWQALGYQILTRVPFARRSAAPAAHIRIPGDILSQVAD